RWQHPERGLVPPDQFIPIAEETGLIIHIGEWVLQQACADAAGWPEDIRVAVNLSPAQLKGDGIRASLTAALKASGLDPRRLEVEITEGLFLADGPHAMEMLQEVKALGVRISIDDFGTGYSSFNYLSSFPFDKIKIDRSFIRGLPEEKRSLAILRSVVGLAKALGISTTAEGIETVQQLLAARVEGCNEVQGYLLSKPKPLAGTEDIIARYNAPGANGCGLLTPQVA
ncbi:MAG: EAL domain-containing protein, partial [Hyphomicrobiaceae bacterium]|nr:EAL domain-containing protein [Hyphomicrobiaceae bacterium]